MSDMETYYIPSSLDAPSRLLFWSIDEACVMLTPMIIGITLGYTVTGMILGLIAFLSWRRIKGINKINHIIYLAYWMLPSCL
jgi:type IV conjugative transfer system protein TraL